MGRHLNKKSHSATSQASPRDCSEIYQVCYYDRDREKKKAMGLFLVELECMHVVVAYCDKLHS